MSVHHPRLAGKGLIIAAPGSGSGKTLVTLGILRALVDRGSGVCSAKAGPDYIDPRFHAKATGGECVNLDPWAMRPLYLMSLATEACSQRPLLIEGMMGLFDGSMDGTGSVADLASLLGLPVVLVVDAARQSHSIAALVEGFGNHRKDVRVAAVILNKVGSDRHEAMLRKALAPCDVPVIGAVKRQKSLILPERHLGLVQAEENEALEPFISSAASVIENSVDLGGLLDLFDNVRGTGRQPVTGLLPLGQNIAIAHDRAFAFSYPHLINSWRQQGATLNFFSPLNNEAPDELADAVYLPGGYPELHAARLAANSKFIAGLCERAQKGATVYGECGGYMVLGEGLVDADGKRHKMAGLLPLVTGFEAPKLHLGYRIVKPVREMPLISGTSTMKAHEFHYASTISEGSADALFAVCDALGENRGKAGLRKGRVMGSFVHLIDVADEQGRMI